MIRYTTGTLTDLTTCINTAIDDLAAPIAYADGKLSSAVNQLNLLIDWTGKPVAHASGPLANAAAQYNALAAYYIGHLFVLMPRAGRSGTFTTPTFAVPAGSSGFFLFRTNMLESTIAAIGYSGSIMLEVSSDGGTNWSPSSGLTWESGVVTKPGPIVHNPGYGFDISLIAGKTIRAQITLATTTNIGFAVESP